jgi:predicted MFS family arabinose efflux permease
MAARRCWATLIGARLTDRFGAMRTLALLCCLQVVLLPTVTLAHLSLAGRIVAVLAWSSADWAVHVPQQSRLTQSDPARAPVLFALHSAALYVGSSVGSAVAAAVLRQHGYDALGPAGAVLIALGQLSLAWRGRSRTTL